MRFTASLLLLAAFFPFTFSAGAQSFNFTLRDHLPYSQPLSNIWGYVDNDGNEYALVGTYSNLSIVNVTDPTDAVELFTVPHPGSTWCEIKTWNNRAYVVNETGGGLLIVDLSQLPNSVTHTSFTEYDLKTAHTLWIDENGILYLFGYNTNADMDNNEKGAMVLDLNADPDNPTLLGTYNGRYFHDGFVRGDTLWGSAIYDGQLVIMDVTDKTNFQLMALQTTPLAFAHNAWPTSDNQYVFTTDEKSNSHLTAYDVSNLNNITELDRLQSNPGSGVVIHNAHLVDDEFVAVSYYTDGVIAVDVSQPDNMIQVGAYDTSPLSGDGFNGAWGVYPYLPSGNWLVSDIENGLFVVSPVLVKAARLQGLVSDSLTNAPINNVSVSILTTQNGDQTGLNGLYKTGHHAGGSYQVQFMAVGYQPRTITVELFNDSIVTRNVKLFPLPSFPLVIHAVDAVTGVSIGNARMFLTDYGLYQFNATGNASGFGTVVSAYASNYDMIIGAWGYRTRMIELGDISGQDTLEAVLYPGYYDDFFFDFGWTTTQTATAGHWVRAVPAGTTYQNQPVNPGADMIGDFGNMAYVTGNGGGDAGDDDVDGGAVVLTSPVFDLTGYNEPFIFYSRWFQNNGGAGTPPNDSMRISLKNGSASATLEHITTATGSLGQWVSKAFKISDFITPTASMQLEVRVVDVTPGHLVEGAFDWFYVSDTLLDNVNGLLSLVQPLFLYPNPASDKLVIAHGLADELPGGTRYRVVSMNGAVLLEGPLSAMGVTLLTTKALPAGVYTVEVTTGALHRATRFVKQ